MRREIGRTLIVGFLVLAPLGASTSAMARAARLPPQAAPSLVVDVSRLRALGLGQQADIVRTVIARTLAEDTPQVRGRLVVRITGLSLSSFGGTNSGAGAVGTGAGGAVNNDYLEGEALIVGPGGQIVDRVPQLMALPSTSGGAYYLPGQEFRRVEELSRDFALWLKRRLG